MERTDRNGLPYVEINRFVKELKNYGLSKQQIKTLRGQALSGDLEGAKKGLCRLTRRKGA